VITIPRVEDEVKIHAPEEYAGGGSVAAKDASGRAVLKPISRQKIKAKPVLFAAAGAGVLVVLAVAFLLRGSALLHDWTSAAAVLGLGAVIVAVPIVMAGYVAMRDAELEPYRGTALWLRVAIVAVVYAGLWGISALFSAFVFTETAPELWQMIPPAAIMIVGGTITAMATLDLEPTNAFFHYAFYLAATVLLRLVLGLQPLVGGADSSTPSPTAAHFYRLDSGERIAGGNGVCFTPTSDATNREATTA
jgi:hypothetical protein